MWSLEQASIKLGNFPDPAGRPRGGSRPALASMNRAASSSRAVVQTGAFWSAPMILILLAHYCLDMCAAVVPSSLNILEQRWNLSEYQSAWLLGAGSLSSGLAQPVFAWISDRTNNRLYGGLGLGLAVVLVCSIGLTSTPAFLFLFYIGGMIGSGMFHPIAASTIGALKPVSRSRIITLFFICGMLGGVSGSLMAPRLLVLPGGFRWLMLVIVPVGGLALALHLVIRGIPHRAELPPAGKRPGRALEPPASDWSAIVMLYLAAAARFTVNIALLYLYVRWMEDRMMTQYPDLSGAAISDRAAPRVGNLNALTMLGMASGGLLAGVLVPAGREKWPLVLMPLAFAPAIAGFPLVSPDAGYLLALLSGIGFASMVPVTLTVAQRLLPFRTSLASGLMLGGAWSLAMTGPVMAEWIIRHQGLAAAFFWTAGLLAVSGVILLPLQQQSLRQSVGR